MSLYQTEANEEHMLSNFDDLEAINRINLTQFIIDTEPEIQMIICRIGPMNCIHKWKRILTPMGICFEMKLQNDSDFEELNMQKKPDILGLMIATNLR